MPFWLAIAYIFSVVSDQLTFLSFKSSFLLYIIFFDVLIQQNTFPLSPIKTKGD